MTIDLLRPDPVLKAQALALLRREIEAARVDVLDAYDGEERAILEDVPVRMYWDNPHDAMLDNGKGKLGRMVSAMFRSDRDGSVEMYAVPLLMQWGTDAEVRQSEMRRILVHEFEHALGRNFDEYAPRSDVSDRASPTPPGWYGHQMITTRVGDLEVRLP